MCVYMCVFALRSRSGLLFLTYCAIGNLCVCSMLSDLTLHLTLTELLPWFDFCVHCDLLLSSAKELRTNIIGMPNVIK